MLANYLNVLVGLLALAGGAFALTLEVLNWRADAAADRAVDALSRPARHARKAEPWDTPTVPLPYTGSWTSSPSFGPSSTAT